MSWARRASPLALLAILTACYSFQGGGGLPSHIRTAYVAPVINQTTRFGLSEELTQQLLEAAQQRLGLQLAAEDAADAVILARLTRFQDNAVNFQAQEGVGADIFTRQITIAAEVQIIDATTNEILFESRGVNGIGEYEPESETDVEGTLLALENLVQKVVDGAQSQW